MPRLQYPGIASSLRWADDQRILIVFLNYGLPWLGQFQAEHSDREAFTNLLKKDFTTI